jgi:hypothetical protein
MSTVAKKRRERADHNELGSFIHLSTTRGGKELIMRRFAWLPCLALVTGTPTVAQERPAPAIRIATYNAYLLSPIFKCLHVNFADCLLQTEGKTEEWAHHLADTILADTDRFDIIVLNEAWDEDAKDILEARLGPRYPRPTIRTTARSSRACATTSSGRSRGWCARRWIPSISASRATGRRCFSSATSTSPSCTPT